MPNIILVDVQSLPYTLHNISQHNFFHSVLALIFLSSELLARLSHLWQASAPIPFSEKDKMLHRLPLQTFLSLLVLMNRNTHRLQKKSDSDYPFSIFFLRRLCLEVFTSLSSGRASISAMTSINLFELDAMSLPLSQF